MFFCPSNEARERIDSVVGVDGVGAGGAEIPGADMSRQVLKLFLSLFDVGGPFSEPGVV